MRINSNYLAIFVGVTIGLAAGCSTKKTSAGGAGGGNDGGSGGAPAAPSGPATPVCTPTGSSSNQTASTTPAASGTPAVSSATPAPTAAATSASGGVIAQTTLNLAGPGSTTTTGDAVPIAATTSGTDAVAGTTGGTTAGAATAAAPSTCVGSNTTPTPDPAATANSTGSANAGGTDATQAGTISPIVTPTGPANFGSTVTLTSCMALKKAWIPASDGSAMCGDPLVSWCCNAQTVAQEFPGSAAALQQAFDKYTSAGSVMYQCSLGTGMDQSGKSVPQYNFYFFKSSSAGFNMGSVFIQSATPAQPNAAACPPVTPAQIGLKQ